MEKANIEEKLGTLTFKTDHSNAHIRIKDNSEKSPCLEKCEDKTCTVVCPATVYAWEEAQKKILVSYENCIECGACRMICPFDNISCEWPKGGFGVQYKMG